MHSLRFTKGKEKEQERSVYENKMPRNPLLSPTKEQFSNPGGLVNTDRLHDYYTKARNNQFDENQAWKRAGLK